MCNPPCLLAVRVVAFLLSGVFRKEGICLFFPSDVSSEFKSDSVKVTKMQRGEKASTLPTHGKLSSWCVCVFQTQHFQKSLVLKRSVEAWDNEDLD